MNVQRLDAIADISTGLQIKTSGGKERYLLQAKHFDEQARLIPENLKKELHAEEVPARFSLQADDIIFCVKGTRNFAVLITEDMLPGTASSIFFLIKVKISKEILLPEYLAWYLNNPATLAHIQSFAKGSILPLIPKSVLANLVIPYPTVDIQREILRLHDMRKEESRLLKQFDALRDEEMHSIIHSIIGEPHDLIR